MGHEIGYNLLQRAYDLLETRKSQGLIARVALSLVSSNLHEDPSDICEKSMHGSEDVFFGACFGT